MLVGVCDFPSEYTFPPSGYGGIERWLWAVAIGARAAGAQVHLLGPRWRSELADKWTLHPLRLENITSDSPEARSLRSTGYDLLVVGHEYLSLPAWRAVADSLDTDVATFQHWPYFQHQSDAFDGVRSRLYCYSEQMRQRYIAHQPLRELAVHHGLGEEEFPSHEGDQLLWMGRIDRQKAPHLAIRAARLLQREITIAGPVFDRNYMNAHRADFEAEHVTMVGEVARAPKMRLLADARALVYTCARDYIEAGAASFGEALRAGTPVAALAWQSGTCAEAALCERTGAVARVDVNDDDDVVATTLANAIEHAASLRAAHVQEAGLARFHPVRHFHALAARPC